MGVPTSAKGQIGLDEVHVAHGAVVLIAQEGAHQAALRRTLALQMFQQRQQRAFTGVQRHIVEVVEDPRFLEFTQLGIDITATQHGDYVRGAAP